MRDSAARTVITGAFVQLLLALGPIAAQSNVETNAPGVQLNFSTPGARSLALGGTFLGRADDATAAYANPAGLANLPDREMSLELRSWAFTHVFTDSGRLMGEPTGIGPDTVRGLVDGKAKDELAGGSFVSFVYPSRRWAIAFYLHTLADFEANFTTQGAFLEGSGFRTRRLFPVISRSELKILTQGVSVAYRHSETLSWGLGVSRYDFEIDSTLERFFFPRGNRPPNIFGEIGDPETTLQNRQTQKGTDTAFGLTFGVLWRLNPRWQLGGVYRQGPGFDFELNCECFGDTLVQEARFNVPDQWGVGVMFQATGRLILGLDFYRIGYSAFADDFTDVFGFGTERDYVADDGSELHAGLEYSFPNSRRPWWLRFGLWNDPEHGVRYAGTELRNSAVFRERGGLLHWAAGGGLTGISHQIDVGVDYSERTTTFSLSTVVRF